MLPGRPTMLPGRPTLLQEGSNCSCHVLLRARYCSGACPKNRPKDDRSTQSGRQRNAGAQASLQRIPSSTTIAEAALRKSMGVLLSPVPQKRVFHVCFSVECSEKV